jgi:hypothetical protein
VQQPQAFVAAYVILEDAWYIIPEKEIRGLKSICLCTVAAEAKYEQYREAWSLLRKASEIGNPDDSSEQTRAVGYGATESSSAVGRMEMAANFFLRRMERASVIPRKTGG